MPADAMFQVIERADGTFRWRLRAEDGTTLATSDGVHETKHAAVRDVQHVKRTAADAGVESITADADTV